MPKDLPAGFDWPLLSEIGGTAGRLDHAYYLFHYASLLPNPCRVVEIGTCQGGSAIAMGMALRGGDAVVVTIDSGEEGAPTDAVLGHVADARLEGYIAPVRGKSEDVLARWDGRPIDLLHVDGDHHYESVVIDCGWMRFVRPGGIAVFDDWIEPVERAVAEYLAAHPAQWRLVTNSGAQPPGCPWKTVFLRIAPCAGAS